MTKVNVRCAPARLAEKSAPLVAGLQKAWQDMGIAVREASKRFRATS